MTGSDKDADGMEITCHLHFYIVYCLYPEFYENGGYVMLEKVLPEQVGVSSEHVKEFIEYLENTGFAVHATVMVRGDRVFYENYWAPFNRDFRHRLYSVSKSFVSLAIGFLVQDGLVDLDAPVVSYFDAEITKGASEYVKRQTIKNMLMMSTGFPQDKYNWFSEHHEDRLRLYFESSTKGKLFKEPGSLFDYDSFGSFVLCGVVEKVSGKTFDEFMHEKLYSKIGVSEDTYTLKCPGGTSWGDSAVMCRAIDLAKVALFTMKQGNWQGEQILDAEYIKTACSPLTFNSAFFEVHPDAHGYGYQIWRTRDNSFFFNGMGCQLAICVPDKDMVFVINADTQGIQPAMGKIMDAFFEKVANRTDAAVKLLPENRAAADALEAYSKSLKLYSLKGQSDRSLIKKINGKQFKLAENPMGITDIKFTFSGDEGVMEYTNAQGEKKLAFGIDKNTFGLFPEEGYSDLVGNTFTPGHYYESATSAKFADDNKLLILVQAIDKYFGRLCMQFGFTDDFSRISVIMVKAAEDFFNTYEGWAAGEVVAG